MADARFDEVLMTIAGQLGGLEPLFDTFFSFLHRHTDLYVQWGPEDMGASKPSMGFPEGVAEKLLLRSFRKYPYKALNPSATLAGGEGGGGRKPKQTPKEGTKVASIAAGSSLSSKAKTAPKDGSDASSPAALEGEKKVDKRSSNTSSSSSSAGPSTGSNDGQDAVKGASAPGAAVPTGSSEASKSPASLVRLTKEGKQIPMGNGGITPKYYWTQTLEEVTVYVEAPPGSKGKDVDCSITPRRLRLGIRRRDPSSTPIPAPGKDAGAGSSSSSCTEVLVEGELSHVVSSQNSLWSIEDGRTVMITLEKKAKTWWKSVLQGDPEIDTSKVDSSKRIHEFDNETQGAIRKIMFDQKQKQLGLPSSDDMTAESILEGAKHLPGSPFLDAH